MYLFTILTSLTQFRIHDHPIYRLFLFNQYIQHFMDFN